MELAELLTLDWLPGILQTYEYLKTEYGDREAETYLRIAHSIDTNPRPTRALEIVTDPFYDQRSARSPYPLSNLRLSQGSPHNWRVSRQEMTAAIESAILQILHPQQLPMSIADIEHQILLAGFLYGSNAIYNRVRALVEAERLSRLDNPYRGGTFLYCHPDFQEELQVGDRVLLLLRRRAARCGVVVRFQRIANGAFAGQRVPLVDWQYRLTDGKPLPYSGYPTFADPRLLILLERPSRPSNSITRRPA